MSDVTSRKYLLRIAENPLKKLGVAGEFSKVVTAASIAIPATGDLLSALPGAGTMGNFANEYLISSEEDKSVAELVSLLPKGELAAIAFNELHFTAKIQGSKSSSSNPCVISVYNMSEENQSKIKAEATVILQAGYTIDEELPLIYAGQVVKVETILVGSDNVTKIYCNAGYTITKNVIISKSFPPGKTYREIIQGIIDEVVKLGIPFGGFYTKALPNPDGEPVWVRDMLSQKPSSGYAAVGYLMTVLTDLCKTIGYRVYQSGGKLYIEPLEYAKSLDVFVLTTDDIVGKVKPSQDASLGSTGGKKSTKGASVTCFLDGRIALNKKIQIEEGEYAGYYDIEDIITTLSYEGNEWYVELKLKGITDG